MIFRSEDLLEQCAGLGPLNAGLAAALKLTVYTENHGFKLSLPVLSPALQDSSWFSPSYVRNSLSNKKKPGCHCL